MGFNSVFKGLKLPYFAKPTEAVQFCKKEQIFDFISLSLHCAFCTLFNYTHQQMHTHIYKGESKSKGKIHLIALIEVTVSNFTYHFST